MELLNAGWNSLRLGTITSEQFQVLAYRAAKLFSRLVPPAALLARAGHWWKQLGHPVSGCFYVALAERERAMLFTADQRLDCASSSCRSQAFRSRSIWPASRPEPWPY